MSRSLVDKWDDRYAGAKVEDYQAAEVLTANRHLLSRTGRALDLACGLGPQGLYLARNGFQVTALDVSPLAVDRLNRHAHQNQLPLQASAVDLTETELPVAAFDVVVVVRYLERGLCEAISRALKPGGLLFYQTFTVERTGPGPSNPDFLLAPGELLSLFAHLQTRYYREDGALGLGGAGLGGEALLVSQAPG